MENYALEFQKLIFEFFKQITILTTAVAVIVPVVAQTLKLHFLTSAVAMVCFIASTICSLVGMWKIAERVAVGANGAPTSWLFWACFFIILGVLLFTFVSVVERILKRRRDGEERLLLSITFAKEGAHVERLEQS